MGQGGEALRKVEEKEPVKEAKKSVAREVGGKPIFLRFSNMNVDLKFSSVPLRKIHQITRASCLLSDILASAVIFSYKLTPMVTSRPQHTHNLHNSLVPGFDRRLGQAIAKEEAQCSPIGPRVSLPGSNPSSTICQPYDLGKVA